MKTYILTMVVLQLLGAGINMTEQTKKAVLQGLSFLAFAAWGLWVIL